MNKSSGGLSKRPFREGEQSKRSSTGSGAKPVIRGKKEQGSFSGNKEQVLVKGNQEQSPPRGKKVSDEGNEGQLRNRANNEKVPHASEETEGDLPRERGTEQAGKPRRKFPIKTKRRRRAISDAPNDKAPRLQQILAQAGYGSRRSCEELILQGRVTVDGTTIRTLGTRATPEQNEVRVDGELVRTKTKVYYMVNKPAGYVSTNRDPLGRNRVVDLIPGRDLRLFTVGRLDETSRGLILVTNDGELSQQLAHPRYGVPKTYLVLADGLVSVETLDKMRRGEVFSDGLFRVEAVRRIRNRGQNTVLEVELNEGQNREIRRLLARLGHKVRRLERIAFGPIKLGNLLEGGYRALTTSEVQALRMAGKSEQTRGKEQRPSKGNREQPPGRGDEDQGNYELGPGRGNEKQGKKNQGPEELEEQ